MGDGLYAVEFQLIIEHLNVQHRAKQGFITRRLTAVAENLLRVVALMAAHFFQLARQTQRQPRQALLRIDIHRKRQDVEHRSSCGQRDGAHAAHKDKPGGVVQTPGQAAQPQRDQRKRQIGTLSLPCSLRKLAKRAAVGDDFQAQDVSCRGAPWQRHGRKRDRRRKLSALRCPEVTVACIRLAFTIALILFHHLGEG